MDETRQPGEADPPMPGEPPAPGERIEQHVVVERTSAPREGAAPRGSPMWPWVLPLVVAVVVLMWYVLTRGEPRSLFSGESAAPAAESSGAPDVQIDLRLPETPTAAEPARPQSEPEPTATPPAAAPAEPPAPVETEQP